MALREIVQDHIAGWFGVDRSQLHVFSGHNLLNNAALLAEAGLGYEVCAGGSFEIRGGENRCFAPLSPRPPWAKAVSAALAIFSSIKCYCLTKVIQRTSINEWSAHGIRNRLYRPFAAVKAERTISSGERANTSGQTEPFSPLYRTSISCVRPSIKLYHSCRFIKYDHSLFVLRPAVPLRGG